MSEATPTAQRGVLCFLVAQALSKVEGNDQKTCDFDTVTIGYLRSLARAPGFGGAPVLRCFSVVTPCAEERCRNGVATKVL